MCEDIFLTGEDQTSSYVAFTLANCCMPTLVKLKPASLFNFRKKYIGNRDNFYKVLFRECKNFGCICRILYESENEIYILVYNKELLYEVMRQNIDNPLLRCNDYRLNTCDLDEGVELIIERYIRYQKRKAIGLSKDFPHEIGIILGYPAADVEEYIRNNGENYLLCGYWKVYHNTEEAVNIFNSFTRIRKEAIRLFYAGRPLKDIISSPERH